LGCYGLSWIIESNPLAQIGDIIGLIFVGEGDFGVLTGSGYEERGAQQRQRERQQERRTILATDADLVLAPAHACLPIVSSEPPRGPSPAHKQTTRRQIATRTDQLIWAPSTSRATPKLGLNHVPRQGLPFNVEGDKYPLARHRRLFAEIVIDLFGIPVVYCGEQKFRGGEGVAVTMIALKKWRGKAVCLGGRGGSRYFGVWWGRADPD